MRFVSGDTTKYVYFVAVDSSDLITRETGLSSFTVYRARNGAAPAAYTTPTIAEVDSTNMPGVYELLLDEDMTLDAGDQSQMVALHITASGMAPVTLQYELYRPSVTAGETLTVATGGINAALGTGVITAGSIAADAIGASELAADAVAEIADAVWDEVLSGHLTAGTTGAALNGAGAAGDPWGTSLPGAYGVGSAGYIVGTNLNATVSSRASQASVDTVDDFLDTEIAAIKAKTDNLPSDPADASDIASSFSTVNSTLSTIAGYIDTEVATIVTQTTAASIRSAVGLASANLDTQLTAIDDFLDTEVAAIKAKTDNLPADPADASDIAARFTTLDTAVADLPTNAELATALGTADDAVLAAIAALSIPSAASVADAVWDEAIAGHAAAGSTGEALSAAGSGADPTTITKVDELHKLHGLDSSNPMTVTPTSRVVGSISQAITGDGETTSTVTRAP